MRLLYYSKREAIHYILMSGFLILTMISSTQSYNSYNFVTSNIK